MKSKSLLQKGSVSLFVVIFSALLIITIVTAFIRIMIQDQSQATANDLSRSAYDSAQAGVEDAKRAIVAFQQYNCNPAAATGEDSHCAALRSALVGDVNANDGWTNDCNATEKAGVATLTNGEVRVKKDDADDSLDQAYTCIKVNMYPRNYARSANKDTTYTVPLKAVDKNLNTVPITKIKFEWYITQPGQTLSLTSDTIPYSLPNKWPTNRPAAMRVQLLQYRPGFTLSDFDKADKNGTNNINKSLFLLPTSTPGFTVSNFVNDFRQQAASAANQPVSCSNSASSGAYACSVTIDLPCAGDPCNDYPTANNDRTAFLKVTPLYSSSSTPFSVTMIAQDGTEARYMNVQPAVDSTGRANDIFKRIRSRIDLGATALPDPVAAVDVTKSLCKEFLVTNDKAYAGSNAVCTPPQN